MTADRLTPPPKFDLPPGRVEQRKAHLVAQISAERRRRGTFAGLFGRGNSRRWRTGALVFAVFVISGTALAATRDWWTAAPPATDQPVVDQQLSFRDIDGHPRVLADPALARTVARAPGATLIAAPTQKGGYCMLPQLPRKPGDSVVGSALGFSCGFAPGKNDARAASTFGTLAAAPDGIGRFYVYGRMTHPAAGAVDLTHATGETLRVALGENGFFMAALRRSTWERLDDRHDEIAILDRDGQVIQAACVYFGPAPFSRLARTADGFGRIRPAPCATEGHNVSAPPQPTEPTPAPAFDGIDAFTGKRVMLADFTGKPVVIQFWDWDHACDSGCTARSSLSELQTLARERPDLDLGIVAFNERPTGFDDIVRRNLPTQLAHLGDRDQQIAKAMGVERFPTLLFLDDQHRVRAKIVGVPTQSELMRGVRIARGQGS